jgi:hypothetical protein
VTLVAWGCDASLSVVVSSRDSIVELAGMTFAESEIGRSMWDDITTEDPFMKDRSIDEMVAAAPSDSRSFTTTRYTRAPEPSVSDATDIDTTLTLAEGGFAAGPGCVGGALPQARVSDSPITEARSRPTALYDRVRHPDMTQYLIALSESKSPWCLPD